MSEIATGKLVIWMRLQAERIKPNGNRTSIMLSAAADRLESQEREIERLKEELEQMEEAATVLHAANETHWTYIKELTARAEQAERERDAAKADMKLIVDAVRETHCDETCCFACKYDFDTSINDSGELNGECPGFDRDDCFEWRGRPQEGDKDE